MSEQHAENDIEIRDSWGFLGGVVAGLMYAVWVAILNVPYYARHFKLIELDAFLFYYYTVFHPFSEYLKEKNMFDKPGSELTYGETAYVGLSRILHAFRVKPGQKFLDLGSGKGKLVCFASLHFGMEATGIELIPSFVAIIRRYSQKRTLGKVTFLEGDFMLMNVSDADVVFVTQTCFSKETRDLLSRKLSALKRGAKVAALTYPIKNDDFQRVRRLKVPTTWGPSAAYIYRKVR